MAGILDKIAEGIADAVEDVVDSVSSTVKEETTAVEELAEEGYKALPVAEVEKALSGESYRQQAQRSRPVNRLLTSQEINEQRRFRIIYRKTNPQTTQTFISPSIELGSYEWVFGTVQFSSQPFLSAIFLVGMDMPDSDIFHTNSIALFKRRMAATTGAGGGVNTGCSGMFGFGKLPGMEMVGRRMIQSPTASGVPMRNLGFYPFVPPSIFYQWGGPGGGQTFFSDIILYGSIP